MTKKQSAGHIPKFKSYEEEADFWDKHSSEEFPDDFEPVQVKFRRPLGIRLAVPLEQSTVKELEEISKKRGMKPVALARQWILEQIDALQH